MVKVAHIITRLDFGGAQGNTLYTVRTLDRSRYVTVLICGPGGDLDGGGHDGDVRRAAHLAREIAPLKDLLAFFELRAMLLAIDPDIVHTHSSKAGILGRLAAWSAGARVIIHTFHGFGFHPRQSFLVRWLYVTLEKFCARFSDALVFVSEANLRTARAAGIGEPGKYRLIRSGVKLSGYPARADRTRKRAELGLGPEDAVVISLGNTKPQKNPAHFLEAAARLAPRFPAARFVFVGGGEALEELRFAARARGLEKVCIFPGWRKDSAELLAVSDVFVLTSLWEGLPRSLVEAMRSGLPSVCYATDGVADILRDGKNGFLAPQGDLDAFCAALSRLLSDAGLRAGLAAGASATDLSEFDIDFMVREQEKLYSELLGKEGTQK